MELYDIEKLAKNNREMVKSLFKQKRIKYLKYQGQGFSITLILSTLMLSD